jgi:hypothetical protein
LAFEKVTRRQGGTLSSRYRSNGYAPKNQRLKESHRQQAGSHSEMNPSTKSGPTKNPQTITHLRVSRFSGQKDQKSSSRHTS